MKTLPKCPVCGRGDAIILRRVLADDGVKTLIAWCGHCDDAVADPRVVDALDPTFEDIAWLAAPDDAPPQ